VHDYAPPIRAQILATAAFEVRLYVPLAVPGLRVLRKVVKAGKVTSYVRGTMLTRDKVEAARYEEDPLIFRKIAIPLLLDLHDTARRLIADAGAIQTPTLMLAAGRDWVVSLKAQRQFFDRLSSPVKRMHVFPAMYHAIFHEKDRAQVIERIREFIEERFAERSVAGRMRGKTRELQRAAKRYSASALASSLAIDSWMSAMQTGFLR
jgi:alpha-beta hydrolase superfamily lysophospholipase